MTTAEWYEKVSEFELDDARYDQPPLAAERPRRSYVICTIPRSGSWLLCRQLYNAGIGVPSEYFKPEHIAALSVRWGADPRDVRAYLHVLQAHRTTPNGAWGTKLMWNELKRHRATVKIELMSRALPIFLVRGDTTSQAASMLVSWITGIWGFGTTPTTSPRADLDWDPRKLPPIEDAIRREYGMWREFFASRRVTPFVVNYEAFVADQPGTVARFAQALGFADGEFRLPPPEPRENAFPADIEARRREIIEHARRERPAAARD